MEARQWFLAYTRSRSQGDLNDFTGFLGNYPLPLIRPNVFSNLSADLPNRFLAWGTVRLPWRVQILPIIEYRNGLPYAQYDVLGNYAGVPNTTRFPNFFSADARVMKDIKVSPKYTVRLSVTGQQSDQPLQCPGRACQYRRSAVRNLLRELSAPVPGRFRRDLLVDDEADFVHDCTVILRRLGYDCVSANSGKLGLETYRQ